MAAYMSFGRQSWPPAKAFTWSILPVAMEVSRFFNWHGFLYYATAPASVAYSTASIVPTILLMALVGRGASPAASSKEPAEPILFWHSLGLGLLVTVLLGCLMASIVDRVEQFSLRNTTMSNLYYLFYVSCGAAGPVFQRLGLDSLPGVGFGQWMFTIAF